MDCRDLKISEMPRADHLHSGDLIPIVQHGHNKTINVQDLVDLFKRILPPPPHPHHPCDPCDPHFEPWDHHHHCHPEPFVHGLDFDIVNKAREDAAIAKAAATTVEGKLDVLQKTADVALDSSQKALNVVRVFKSQLGQIKQLAGELQYLKAEERNNRSKIARLAHTVAVLIEKVKMLEMRTGLDVSVPDAGNDWLDSLQDPYFAPDHCGPHHHHKPHHHPYKPGSIFDGDDTNNDDDSGMTSEWVDSNVTGDNGMTSDWVDDNSVPATLDDILDDDDLNG